MDVLQNDSSQIVIIIGPLVIGTVIGAFVMWLRQRTKSS